MKRALLIVSVVLSSLGVLVLSVISRSVQPAFTNGVYRVAGEQPQRFTPPLRFRHPSPVLEIDVDLVLPSTGPTLYHVSLLGCIDQVRINGAPPRRITFPFCDGGVGRQLSLSPFLHVGRNRLSLTISHAHASVDIREFSIRASGMDTVVLSLNLLRLLLVVAAGVALTFLLWKPWTQGSLCALVVVLGVCLRMLVVSATPYAVRAYDPQSHVAYVQYMAQHWSVPPLSLGREMFHPPLYYALSALWLKGMALLRRSAEFVPSDLQVPSLLLSIAALGVAVWVGGMLLRASRDGKDATLFAAVAATFPGLLLFAPRINNDVLSQVLAFALVGSLIRWWQEGRDRDWYTLSVITGLSLLTKINALSFLPIVALCLLLRGGISGRGKLSLLSRFVATVVILTGWYAVLRYVVEGQGSIVGHVDQLYAPLRMDTALSHFLSFHPLRILTHPFTEDLHDVVGRPFFWEYLFRSAHFGPFRFPQMRDVSVLLLAGSLTLLPLMALGLCAELRRIRAALPLHLVFLFTLGAQVAYRILYPYSYLQDFRFSVVIVLPLAYYLVRGLQSLPAAFGGMARHVVIGVLASYAAFPVILYLYS